MDRGVMWVSGAVWVQLGWDYLFSWKCDRVFPLDISQILSVYNKQLTNYQIRVQFRGLIYPLIILSLCAQM